MFGENNHNNYKKSHKHTNFKKFFSSKKYKYAFLISHILPIILIGCTQSIEENHLLKNNVEKLEKSNSTLKTDLEARMAEIETLRKQLKEQKAATVTARIGLESDNSELYANIETSLGNIKIRLFWKESPYIVQNFVTLANGTREWVDPSTSSKQKKPFYDGLTFHRVIEGFMIQGGDPLGSGRGGPGYTIPDEISPNLSHNKPGIVAMANAGPDTNGSQFFILDEMHLELDGKYSIFGEVVDGLDVVHNIAKVKKDDQDKPIEPVYIKHITIIKN